MSRQSRRPAQSAKDESDDERPPRDFDPEDISDHDAAFESDSAASSDDDTQDKSREHYVKVGKSALRKPVDVALGPQYQGSRVARREALDDDGDDGLFEHGDEDEGESSEGIMLGSNDEDSGGSSATSDDDEDEAGAGSDEDGSSAEGEVDRDELRRIMAQERKTIAASMSQAVKTDVEKGKAVKAQRKTFDMLLNVRIRLQKSLIATNSITAIKDEGDGEEAGEDVVQAAERAAFSLWSSLNDLRASLTEARTGSKRKRNTLDATSPSSELWSTMQAHDAAERPHRRAVLDKWSAKTQSATAVLASAKGQLGKSANGGQQQLSDYLSSQLLDPARLVKRTRMARSCAPIQARLGQHELEDVYDDADFYGVMLKELLERRGNEDSSAGKVGGANGAGGGFITGGTPWQAAREAKVKKVVDTKASKGRKLRYRVHEKLQNFMAPEDRRSWGERQIDELFGSLFGQRMGVNGGEERGVDEESEDKMELDGVTAQEQSLLLFR